MMRSFAILRQPGSSFLEEKRLLKNAITPQNLVDSDYIERCSAEVLVVSRRLQILASEAQKNTGQVQRRRRTRTRALTQRTTEEEEEESSEKNMKTVAGMKMRTTAPALSCRKVAGRRSLLG